MANLLIFGDVPLTDYEWEQWPWEDRPNVVLLPDLLGLMEKMGGPRVLVTVRKYMRVYLMVPTDSKLGLRREGLWIATHCGAMLLRPVYDEAGFYFASIMRWR